MPQGASEVGRSSHGWQQRRNDCDRKLIGFIRTGCSWCIPCSSLHGTQQTVMIWYVYGWPKPHIHTYIRCMYDIFSRWITIHAVLYVGLARTIYIQCIYGIFGREITKYTVIYGVYIQFWPTLPIRCAHLVLDNPRCLRACME